MKPQNTLWNPDNYLLKICDFGSAKKINSNEESISYIGSRFYRAPELVLGSTKYDESVDMWAVGCMFAEAVIRRPIFFSKNNADLFFEMMKVNFLIQTLGSPTEQDIKEMGLENKTMYEIISVKGKGLENAVPLKGDALNLL